MKRKFNYTGRKKIEMEKVAIRLIRENGLIRAFSLDRLEIEDLGLPAEAKIYVQAYYKTERRQFELGTVGKRTSTTNFSLAGLAYPENLKFRVFIVAPDNGRILAHITGISPEVHMERKPILPVEFKDIGNAIWRVEFEGEEESPVICINNKIPNIQNISKTDPQFFIYVYPSVVREIFTYMVFIDKIDSSIDPSIDWHAEWLNYSRILGVQPPEILNPEDSNFDEKEALKWIETVVEQFCNKYYNEFETYIKKLEVNP